MATDNRVARLQLRIETFKQDADRAQRILNDLNKSMGDVGRAAQQANRNTTPYSAGLRRMAEDARVATAEQARLRNSINDTLSAQRRLNEQSRQQSAGGASGVGRRIQRAGVGLYNLPDPGNMPFTEISRGLQFAGAGISAGGIAPFIASLGLVAPAAIIAAAALDQFSRGLELQKQRLQGALRAEEQYSQALLNSTTEQAAKTLEEQTRRRDQLQARAAAAQERMNNAFADSSANFGDFGARLLDNQTGVSQLREEYERLRGELSEADALVAIFTQEIANNAFAANDAADAERRLAEERARTASLNISSILEIERMIASGAGVDEAQTKLADLRREFQLLQEYGQGASDRAQELSFSIIRLEKALSTGVFSANELFDRLNSQFEETREGMQKLGEAVADSNARIADANADLKRKIFEATRETGEALTEAQYQAELARSEAIYDANKDRVKAENDHLKTLKKLNRDFTFDAENAIQSRNAVALDEANRQRDKERTDIQERLDEQLGTINDRYNEATREINNRLRERNRLIYQREFEAIRAATEAAQRIVSAEQVKQNALVALEAGGANNVLNIHRAFWNNALTIGTNAAMAMARQSAGQARSQAIPTVAPAVFPTLPTTSTGGPQGILGTGSFSSDFTNYWRPPRVGDRQVSGLTVNLNGMGMTPRQVGLAVEDKLEAWVRAGGDI